MSLVADRLLSLSVVASLLLPLHASAQNAKPNENTNWAIEVELVSDGWSFDEAAYAELKTYVTSLITQNRLDRYIVRGWGIEGGEVFCIQARLPIYLPAIIKRLEQIRPSAGTSYTRRLARECRIEQ